MALVLCKGKPYSPPVLHGYTFECRGPENEFPGPNTPWGAEVEEKDFHKFLIGVEGSPFVLDDPSVVVPPPPPVVESAPVVPVAPIPGAVPTADAEAAAALQRSAIASGTLKPTDRRDVLVAAIKDEIARKVAAGELSAPNAPQA